MLDDTWFQILQITELLHAKYECRISNRQCGKFRFFFVTRILREISFGEFEKCRSSEVLLLAFKKCKNLSKMRASKCVKMADFDTLDFLTLISRKI